MTTFTPSDVPALRRELAEWHSSPRSVEMYMMAVVLGKQPIKPSGNPLSVAASLAATEYRRISQADLWYFDTDLCDLLEQAAPTMPTFSPTPQDLPSKTGFVTFARPIALRPAETDRLIADHIIAESDHETKASVEQILDGKVEICAASWGPGDYTVDNKYRAGYTWISFYAKSHARDAVSAGRRHLIDLPTLLVDGEAIIPWTPEGVQPDEIQFFTLNTEKIAGTTLSWGALLLAAFRLAQERSLVDPITQPTSRPERRRTQRADLPPRDVRIIRLHRRLAEQRTTQSAGREYRSRWIVRGHWRRQWYPSIESHRPRWIHPYLKGPAEGTLLGGDRVHVP